MFNCILKNIIVAAVLHRWSSFLFFFYLRFKKLQFLVFKFKNGSKLFISSLCIGQLIAKLQSIFDESLICGQCPQKSFKKPSKEQMLSSMHKMMCFSIQVIRRDHQPLIFRSVEVKKFSTLMIHPSGFLLSSLGSWSGFAWGLFNMLPNFTCNFLFNLELCQWKWTEMSERSVKAPIVTNKICEWWG